MNKADKTFHEKLLDMEKPDDKLKQQYEKEVQKMLQKKLTYLGRAGFAALAALSLYVGLELGHLATKSSSSDLMILLLRFVVGPGAIVAFALTLLAAWIAVRGRLNLKLQPQCVYGGVIALGFFLVTTGIFVYVVPLTVDRPVGWTSIFGIQLALIGFFLLVTFGFIAVFHILYRSDFKTGEKLLEIEYRIAELAEKMETKAAE